MIYSLHYHLVIIGLALSCILPKTNAQTSDIGPYEFKHLKELPPRDSAITYGAKIPRTMHLLSTSTAERPNKVKILFFGQSITRQDYSRKIIEAKLRQAYPHAQLEVLNTAIGGYQAPRSLLTMHHTLIPHQPDLVVFHVYGGEDDGAYEAVIKNIQAYTSAELLTVTHHLDNYDEYTEKKRMIASELRRKLAAQYTNELADVRQHWQPYLKKHRLDRTDLLNDNIHHNAHGGELWGALQARHFEPSADASETDWAERITRIRLGSQSSAQPGKVTYETKDWSQTEKGITSLTPNAKLTLPFTGSRIDIISRAGTGKADIRIDGKQPSELAATWAATLPTSTPIDYRPAIMRVQLSGQPVEETWTATVISCSDDGKEFTYQAKGSKSGEQGTGTHEATFRSTNGIIQIEPQWFTLAHAIQIKKKPLPIPFDITWQVYPTSKDQWQFSPANMKANPSGQVTLVQQLPPGDHQLELTLAEGDLVIEEILIYR